MKEEAEPGRYFLFTKRVAQGIAPDTHAILLEVNKPEGEKYLQRIAADAVGELAHAISTNIENLLKE